jgi:hypothetical protein
MICRIMLSTEKCTSSQCSSSQMGYFVRFQESAVACASFNLARGKRGRGNSGAEVSFFAESIVVVVGALSCQIMLRSSRGSEKKLVNADIIVVVMARAAVFDMGVGSGGMYEDCSCESFDVFVKEKKGK